MTLSSPSRPKLRFLLPFSPLPPSEVWAQPVVWGNLLFLGVAASMGCYLAWTAVLQHLGTMRATNYIYFNPLVTLLAAAAVLGERITAVAAVGACLILTGVWMAERRNEHDTSCGNRSSGPQSEGK